MRSLLALTLSALAVALPAHGAPQAESKAVTIRLISSTTQYKVLVDRHPKNAPSPGDWFWAKSILRNEIAQFGKAKGAVVGSDVATIAVVSLTTFETKVTAKLPGGTLKAAGRMGDDRVEKLPVVGGTGAFAGARGTVEVISLNASGDRTRNVYRLRLP